MLTLFMFCELSTFVKDQGGCQKYSGTCVLAINERILTSVLYVEKLREVSCGRFCRLISSFVTEHFIIIVMIHW